MPKAPTVANGCAFAIATAMANHLAARVSSGCERSPQRSGCYLQAPKLKDSGISTPSGQRPAIRGSPRRSNSFSSHGKAGTLEKVWTFCSVSKPGIVSTVTGRNQLVRERVVRSRRPQGLLSFIKKTSGWRCLSTTLSTIALNRAVGQRCIAFKGEEPLCLGLHCWITPGNSPPHTEIINYGDPTSSRQILTLNSGSHNT